MKIPHTVSNLTQNVYSSSRALLVSVTERDRRIVAENFNWDDKTVPPPSTDWCQLALSKVFDKIQPLDLILRKDFNALMELYPTDVELKYTVPLIFDDHYWMRCWEARWPNKKQLGVDSWKAKYLSGVLQDYLENASADVFDVEEANTLADLLGPYIKTLSLTQLRMVRPLQVDIPYDHEVADECPFSLESVVDHIPLESVLLRLKYLEEISIVFGMNNLEEKYDKRLFEFSKADCVSLCLGLESLENLRVFRINRSNLDCSKVKVILQYLVAKTSLEEIDFSHCQISNNGGKAIAGFIMEHTNIRVVRLCNNPLGDPSMQGLAFALQSKPKAPLETLDMRLNALSDASVAYFASALVRCREKPKKLVVAGCGLKGEAAKKMIGILALNRSLVEFDISANDLTGEAEQTMLEALEKNYKVMNIDYRNTGVSAETVQRVEELLERNRTVCEAELVPSVEIPPLFLNEPEYLVWDYNPNNPDHEPGRYPPRKAEG